MTAADGGDGRRAGAERVIAGLYPGAAVRWMLDESGASWIVEVTVGGEPIDHPVWARLLLLGLPLLPWTAATATVRTMARAELAGLRRGSVGARAAAGEAVVLEDGRVVARAVGA